MLKLMKILEDKILDPIVMKNLKIASNYFIIKSVLVIFCAFTLNSSFFFILVPFITILIIAYLSNELISSNKNKILNYFPFWFLAGLLSLSTLIFVKYLDVSGITFKLIVSGNVFIYASLWILTIRVSEKIANDLKKVKN